MSRGAGRLETAVLMAIPGFSEVSTTDLCRAVYPSAQVIEKKHRVAVLQVLHRLMSNPPRPLEDRLRTIEPTGRRGFWRTVWPESSDPPYWQTVPAYHEAGHALADLYCGYRLDRVVVHTSTQLEKMGRRRIRGHFVPTYLGYVMTTEDQGQLQSLISLLAGPIAEAHYAGKWPHRERGLSGTYDDFLRNGSEGSDRAKIERLLAAISDDPDLQETIRLGTQKLAQALIRSGPGWRFIELLAAKLLKLKHGRLNHQSCAAVFKKAFGRPPPASHAWDGHWPPTLAKMRVGWLPPE